MVKRVLIVVLIIAMLSGTKYLLDRFSPTSIIFHYNLLTGIQYFLLIGLILWAVLQTIFFMIRKRPLPFKWFAILYLGALTCSEVYFYFALRDPAKTNERFHNLLTEYYTTYEINFPELMYDPVVSYTLKKNSVYAHDNIEFSNEIRANNAGLRDDDASLSKPDIICLGDSYTMGWGVPAEKAYPHLLEQKAGFKVLNAGISSYGTARELLLLDRLDTANLKYLVIQYCYNDRAENDSFLVHHRYLPVGSQESRDKTFRSYQYARMYFPFKYTFTLLRMSIRERILALKKKSTGESNYSLDYVKPAVESFLAIISASNINFKKWKVIIIDTNRFPVFDHHFLETMETMLQQDKYSDELRSSIQLVKFPELNHQRYFYPLDNHLNEAGHALVAEKLMPFLKKQE